MANDQSSSLGLKPFAQPGQRIKINYYQINTGQNLFRWQPVVLNNSGQVAAAVAGTDLTPLLGSIVGFLDSNRASLPTNLTDLTQGAFLDSGNNGLAAVADDINQEFILEEDTGGSLIGSANSSGKNVAFTFLATTGNTTTGVANAVLDRSTIAAGTGEVLTIIRPYDENVNSDGTFNDVTGNFAKWIVRINSHVKGVGTLYSPGNLQS